MRGGEQDIAWDVEEGGQHVALFAEPRRAGDGLQRPLRFRFQPRLTPGVRQTRRLDGEASSALQCHGAFSVPWEPLVTEPRAEVAMPITGTFAHLGWFLGYLITSWLLLMALFRLAARRKHYFHIVPFVIGYAVLVAFLLRYLGFRTAFRRYLALSSLFLFVNLRRHLVFLATGLTRSFILGRTRLSQCRRGTSNSKSRRKLSPNRQITQHVIGSVVVFIMSFVLTFYLCNGGL